jgi:diguanylate cyclase (GGDEF)-like protein
MLPRTLWISKKILVTIEVALVLFVTFWIIYLSQQLLSQAAKEQDRIETKASSNILFALIEKDRHKLEDLILDYTHWDDARLNIEFEPNSEWKSKMIAESLNTNLGIDLSIVFDSNNQVSHLYTSRVLSNDLNAEQVTRALEAWMQTVRENPLNIKHTNTGFKIINGHVFVLAAGSFVSEDVSVDDFYKQNAPDDAVSDYVMVFGSLMDQFTLNELQQSTKLLSLELGAPPCQNANCLELDDYFQEHAVALRFTQTLPGESFIQDVKNQSWSLIISIIVVSAWVSVRLFLAYFKLKISAETDGLTGLYNRKTFEHILARWLHTAKRTRQDLSVIAIDLDHFKAINDNYGHETGDAVLEAFSKLLKANIRSSDICARIGGEEFAILMPGTKAEDAKRLTEKLRQLAISDTVQISRQEISYHFSAGISSLAISQTGNQKKLLRHADKALYQAKDERNKTVIYTPSV